MAGRLAVSSPAVAPCQLDDDGYVGVEADVHGDGLGVSGREVQVVAVACDNVGSKISAQCVGDDDFMESRERRSTVPHENLMVEHRLRPVVPLHASRELCGGSFSSARDGASDLPREVDHAEHDCRPDAGHFKCAQTRRALDQQHHALTVVTPAANRVASARSRVRRRDWAVAAHHGRRVVDARMAAGVTASIAASFEARGREISPFSK